MAFNNQPDNPNYGGNRLQLFNIEIPLTFTMQEFEEKWTEVDNIWTQFGVTKLLKKDPSGWTKTYDCRFRKRRAYTKKNLDIPVDKQRKTSSWEANLYEAQITITFKSGIVIVRKTHPDGPNHTHDLKANDIIKWPSKLITFIKDEAKKGYRAPAIKEAAINQFKDQEVGTGFLQLEAVLNAQHKVRGGLNIPYIGATSLDDDIDQALKWLQSNNYQTKQFEEPEYRGFALANQDNLNALQSSGHLVIMDLTHKTNKHDWKLYTLLVRNSFGSWLPGGHFFVSAKEQNIVAKGLQVLKHWVITWRPRYFLIDQSAIEERAINQIFPGIIAGKQNIGIFYCTWHCQRTLQRNLESYGKGYELMLQAMYKTTRIGCEQVIQEAITMLPLETKKTYIQHYWLKNTSKWALWSRQNSPILLQITSTSPVESYHAVLKKKGNASFGIIGACMIVGSAN